MDRSQISRRRRTILAAQCASLAVLASVGCAISMPFAQNKYGAPLPENAGIEEVVQRVNANIERLQAWRSSDLRISGRSLPVHLTGHVAVERPRNFRLTAGALGMTDEADFGSNSEWFWFWVHRGQPPYVFQARHDDMQHSEVLRQAIPFQPDWLIEALGVVPIDPKQVSRIEPGEDRQTVNLIFDLLSPSNQPVQKIIRVDLRHSVVLGHYLYDANRRLIAKADLGKFEVQEGIIMPHLISLEWPQAGAQSLQISLELGQIEINPNSMASHMFEVPNKAPNYPSCDIGARTRSRNVRVDGSRVGRLRPGSESTSAERDASPAGFDSPPPEAAGRVTLDSDNGQEWNKPIESPQGASDPRASQPSAADFGSSPSQPAYASSSRPVHPKPAPGDPFGSEPDWSNSPPAQTGQTADSNVFETPPH